MDVVFRGDDGPVRGERDPHGEFADVSRIGHTDRRILRLLRDRDRDGVATEVVLRDGTRLLIFNICWGYEITWGLQHSGEYAPNPASAQVTTNISPAFGGAPVDIFDTAAVIAINDPETGTPLMAVG